MPPGNVRETPSPAGLTEQPTTRQPSFSGSNPANGPLPQTPRGYVQGQHGRYGPGQAPPFGPKTGPQGPGGPQMSAPPQQRPGGPMRAPLNAPAPNSFRQNNSGPSFAGSGGATMLATPPAPGTFNPNRPPFEPGPSIGNRPGVRRSDGPPEGKGKRKKKRRVPIWARVVIGFLIVLLLLGGTAFAYYQTNYAGVVNNVVGQTVARTRLDGADPNANLTNGILTGPRVNILLLGSDTDQKFQNGQYIAQTDIVVTIDPTSKTVGMLSIPRDFYINVPGYGLHKLDEAYGLGGVALSRRTIEQDFGISINYYAWVGLDGFIKVIDTVGGVDVDVLHPIVDDNYPNDTGANANDPYALKRLYLSPGPQHLDGPTALDYVRSRHADLVGDFGRSARQQEVLSALKTKLDNPSVFGQLPQIAGDLNGFVKTDMQLPDVLKLMNFARGIKTDQINKLTLGPPYSHSATLSDGTSVVMPDCTKIIPAISQFLQLGNRAACNIGYTGAPPALATSTPTVPDQPLTTPGVNPQPTPLTTPAAPNQPTPMSTSGASTQPAPTATSDTSTQPTPASTSDDGNDFQGWGNMAGNATSSLEDLFGVRSLLDLLFLGVFESPAVFQV